MILWGLCGGVQPLFVEEREKTMSEYRSYTEHMTVLDGDSDFRRCLKPSALFRYVEQVSADHARAYGITTYNLRLTWSNLIFYTRSYSV